MIRLPRTFSSGAARRAVLTLSLGGLAALGVAGCASVSQQQEVQMGAQYAQQINAQLPLVRDPEVVRYITVLGDSLARVTPRADLAWQFYLVDSPEVNAFAVPGGFVYVNRGLVERAQTMSEVAGVLGHEIGHVVKRHSIKQMEQQQKGQIGVTLACVLTRVCNNPAAGTLINTGAGALFAKFSRQDEAEADQQAVVITTRAGIDPRGIPSMFRILLNEREQRPAGVAAWFATHPLEESRIASTERQIQETVPPAVLASLTRDTRNFHTFQARLRALPRAAQPAPQGQ